MGWCNGSNGLEIDESAQPKNSRCKSFTPPPGEERDSDKRTMGVVSMVMDHRAAVAS
jgi:hypothetical protein